MANTEEKDLFESEGRGFEDEVEEEVEEEVVVDFVRNSKLEEDDNKMFAFDEFFK